MPKRLALLLAALALPASAQSLCTQIKALTADPTVASAHWGVSVTRLDGTGVCGINDAQLFRPASNNKIFTTATALALLGPNRRFVTRVVSKGTLHDGVLEGDLELRGGGDANFGAHDLPYLPAGQRPKDAPPEPGTIADIEELAAKVAATGLTHIAGDVVGTEGYFAWEPYPPAWSLDDLPWGYGAPVASLTIHDNQVVARAAGSAAIGELAALTFTPAMPWYQVSNTVRTYPQSGNCDASVFYHRAPGSRLLDVFGSLKPGASCTEALAIDDPPAYAAAALKAALERRGVTVAGRARADHPDHQDTGSIHSAQPEEEARLRAAFERPDPALPEDTVRGDGIAGPEPQELARHTSPTLLEDMVYTNKTSQNLHAELMLRNLGALYAYQGTQRESLRVVRLYLEHAGVQPSDFLLYDGSGLSDHDLVAPRALTKFLGYAAAQPWFAAWRGTLPEGGVDGTLTSRFPTLKGRIFAKTGTLGETRALSGYIATATGETLVFSILVDTHLPGTADRVIMDRIVTLIAGQNLK